jgi:hypothetical protein
LKIGVRGEGLEAREKMFFSRVGSAGSHPLPQGRCKISVEARKEIFF